jgi:hypothetical protein
MLQRKYDSSAIFILAGLQKVSRMGLLGFISSITWQTGENYIMLRKHLFERGGIECLVNLPFDVFKDAYVDTGIHILAGSPRKVYRVFRFPKKVAVDDLQNLNYTFVETSLSGAPDYKVVLAPEATALGNRLLLNPLFVTLGSLSISTQGLAGNLYNTTKKRTKNNRYAYLENGQVFRYSIELSKVAYTSMADKPSLVGFYEKKPKILVRRVISRQDRLMATYFDQEMVFRKDINPFLVQHEHLSPLYLLGLMNSKLISYLYVNTSSIATKDDFRQTTLSELRRLPIRAIDFTNPEEKKMQGNLVALVDKMLGLHKQVHKSSFDSEKEPMQRQIAATDKKIDDLVYKLYGLTEEEIKIVEESTLA